MTDSTLDIRLRSVRDALTLARQDAGIAKEVTLLAVSKRHSVESIRAAYDLGQRDFGESYAQELRDKATELADLPEIRWHYIGALQRNKVKLLTGVRFVHTIDRFATAKALANRFSPSEHQCPQLLIQVNFDEPQKAGVLRDKLDPLVEQLRELSALRIRGLMTIPPRGTPETTRPYFERLASIAAELRARHSLGPDFDQLSMGMSGDFREAIAAGATIVRVGTAIFGPRPPAAKT